MHLYSRIHASILGCKMDEQVAAGHIDGKTALNKDFSQDIISAVWEKGRVMTGADPAKRRKDCCGAWIDRDQYGVKVENGSGWEIDHIVPVAKGGSDDINNLQPLQWENNRAKGDAPEGAWFCVREARN